MSYPYIIWTMRRTGGTTLASLLSTLSEHAGVQHEPFNSDRIFGHIASAFAQTDCVAQLRLDLQACLAQTPLIKHCHELMSPAFNQVLLDVTTALGYRHIILDRHSEADRIISLELAYLTGAWGGEAAQKIYPAIEAGEMVLEPLNMQRAVQHTRLCMARRQELAQIATAADLAPFVVYFEDVYNDPKAGRLLIERLLGFLDIEIKDRTAYEKRVDDALLRRGQNSARILQAVPNADAAKQELEALLNAQTSVFQAS
ncbi:hypothetical protein ACEN2J_15015 [Pseudorhodobacter sp. W20_MBD10_FR17]|uniref:hypothetical protein n=1 Tax=Pseudorhodobacter sp. W20_MBD10_FR17 TaxID=3240266 RepID=UPI003F9764AF